MSSKSLIYSLDRRTIPGSSGNKAIRLHHLIRKNHRVPKSYACTWAAYQRYISDDLSLIDDLRAELSEILQPGKSYAVRSSANVEDGFDRSFAGQFKTVLDTTGVEDVLLAIWSIWSSTQSEIVTAYLSSHDISADSLQMGAIIQEMVFPIFSGVALSKNPVSGADEIIIEAVAGSGDQLVQGGHTPDRWVYKWGTWLEKAVDSQIPSYIIEQIATETEVLTQQFGAPVDLEWVFDGSHLYWVQIREITGLNQQNVYSNNLSKEFIPGMIKPLIYSINIPLVNGVWIDWISEVTGELGIQADELAKSFYYHVYFNMGVLGKIFSSLGFPAESAEMLMGTLPEGASRPSFKPTLKTFSRLPWLFAFIFDKWRFASKMKKSLRKLEPVIKDTKFQGLDSRTPVELLAAIDRHHKVIYDLAYFNVLGPLLMGFYNTVLARLLLREGIDFSDFDVTEGMSEFRKFDPSHHLEELNKQFLLLPDELQHALKSGLLEMMDHTPEGRGFLKKFEQLVEDFGYLSDSGNDISATPWRETPELVLELVTAFEPLPETNPQKVTFSELKVQGLNRLVMKLFYQRAREFRLLREQVSQLYTFGYGLFRYYYLALGEHLVASGELAVKEDIFYLTDQQVRGLVNGTLGDFPAKQIVNQHKEDMDKYQSVSLPIVIYGDKLPPVRDVSTEVLHGVASSAGMYSGQVRVVSGLQDFSAVKPGDVLVVPYSDVGWTPLFRHAGAVIAESGGLLSHSSIVAREYNIPAVVNVPGATKLTNGTNVTVDGHRGIVFIQ